MSIGGKDMFLMHPKRTDYLDAIKTVWPNAVQEADPEIGFFVYKDAEAQKLWDEKGDHNANDMIYVIPELNAVTLVVFDDKDPAVKQVVQAISGAAEPAVAE